MVFDFFKDGLEKHGNGMEFYTGSSVRTLPGVWWVKNLIFFKVRVSIRTCVPNLGAIRRERFLTIYNPLNPPGVGGSNFLFSLR